MHATYSLLAALAAPIVSATQEYASGQQAFPTAGYGSGYGSGYGGEHGGGPNGGPYGGGGDGNGHDHGGHGGMNQQRADAVREAFLFAWDNYYQYAFPADELRPVNKTPQNTRNGWGASAVDALSTAIVMELPDVVNQIIEYIPKINYGVSANDQSVSLFETTIRYLAGMLSGYDFLNAQTGPLAHLAKDQNNVKALLSQSEKLADYLSYAFNTPSGVPTNNLFFGNRSDDKSTTNGLAQIGSLVMEWTHLSDLTGNQTYGQLAEKGESYLLNPKPQYDVPFPGLVGTGVYLSNGTFADASGGWVGGDDSYYEYLIKMFVYDSIRYGYYKDHWTQAADSSIEYLASHPSSRPDLTFLAAYNNKTLDFESQHLACFDGGNFILAGLVLGSSKYLNFGLTLTSACHDTYTSTTTRIGPEVFSWNTTNLPANQTEFYNKNGFWIETPSYDLRPEVIESYYYAYQATHDQKYRDWAWDAFVAINATCRTTYGFTAVSDVNTPGGGKKLNDQESFLFAEVLKYSYLIQSDQAPWDVNYEGKNFWVFNTEAHPIRVHGPPV